MSGVLVMMALLLGPAGGSDLEQRVMKLSQQFRCLVCQNETIADSHADLAADLRQQIREQMIAGRTDSEITSFLSDRYGDFVLYRPRVTPKTYALWFGPFALLAGGLYALFVYVKRWPPTRTRRALSEEEHRRAEKILKVESNPNVAVYRDQLSEMDLDERDREDLIRRLLDDCRELGSYGDRPLNPLIPKQRN